MEAYTLKYPKPPEKPPEFDLKEGDIVSTQENGTRRFYRVTHISWKVFMCVDRRGFKTTFMKKQYQLGEVRRVNA